MENKNGKPQRKTKMENKKEYLFTSEVVSPGHPDKCADIIADTIVDKLILFLSSIFLKLNYWMKN